MKKIKPSNYFYTLFLILTVSISSLAQKGIDKVANEEEITKTVDSIAKLVEANYISKDIGKNTSHYIKQRQQKGAYDGLSYKKLAKRLTKDLRTISEDLHMSAFYSEFEETPNENILSTKLNEYGENSNYGYVETKIYKNNTGYLKIGHFTQPQFFQEAKESVDLSMSILKNTNALIIDVRDNPGGFEEIVAYFMSYFFDEEPIYLQEYYARYLDRKRSISTTNQIPGKRLPEIPIYILVDNKTASAGESLAYMMKHLKRATIIGETTSGAGNGSTYFRVSNEFMVQIATWETINSITKSSWEKVGVVPNIKVKSNKALNLALELAEVSGVAYKSKLVDSYKTYLSDMDKALEEFPNNSSTEILIKSITDCAKNGLITESGINTMGYHFLMQEQNPTMAEVIFEANTILFPKSANVYDSYAETLALNGKLEASISNYEKAVKIGIENEDSNLNLFKENLENVKKQLQSNH
jgi:hypothetical protein